MLRIFLIIGAAIFLYFAFTKVKKAIKLKPYSKYNKRIIKLLVNFVNDNRYSDIVNDKYVYKLENDIELNVDKKQSTKIVIKDSKNTLLNLENEKIDVNLFTLKELKKLLK